MKSALFEVEEIEKRFKVSSIFWKRDSKLIYAVNKVSLSIYEGEILGLIGESGCGKTTMARLLVRLLQETGGNINFMGKSLSGLSESKLRPLRKNFQMIFQDPYESINPGMRILEVVGEPLVIQGLVKSKEELRERVAETLERIELKPAEDFLMRFPHQLSGGQRQRVAVARSLILKPRFIAADEPTSMLDVSVSVGILNLLLEMKKQMGLTMLFITHNISTARYMCDRIGIMYKGRLVEIGPTKEIIKNPAHPYTRALVSVVKDLIRFIDKRQNIIKDGQVNSESIGEGCIFQERCVDCCTMCGKKLPELREIKNGHYVACCR